MNEHSFGHPPFHQVIQIALQFLILWQTVLPIKLQLDLRKCLPSSLPWEQIEFQLNGGIRTDRDIQLER